MTINSTDRFLVNRNNTSHYISAENAMSTIQDSDLFLINRGNQSYKVTAAQIRQDIGDGTSPTLRATAKGSISTGRSCKLNADGSVSQITADDFSETVGAFDLTTQLPNCIDNRYSRAIYIPELGKGAIAYTSNTNETMYVAWITGDGNNAPVFSDEFEMPDEARQVQMVDLCYDPLNKRLFVAYDCGRVSASGSYGIIYAIDVTGGVFGAISDPYGFGSNIYTSDNPYINVDWDPIRQNVSMMYYEPYSYNSQQRWFQESIRYNPATDVVVRDSYGSYNKRSTPQILAQCWDPNRQRIVSTYSMGNNIYVDTFKYDPSVKLDAEVSFQEVGDIWNMEWSDKLSAFVTNGKGGSQRPNILKPVGESFILSTLNDRKPNGYLYFAIVYDEIAEVMIGVGCKSATPNQLLRIYGVVEDGVNLVWDTSTETIIRDDGINYVPTQATYWDSSINKAVFVCRREAPFTGSGLVVYANAFGQISNSDNSSFIGFADGNYSDGQRAKIDTKGGVNDQQSGLTAGQLYGIKRDGDLIPQTDPDYSRDAIAFAGTGYNSTSITVQINTNNLNDQTYSLTSESTNVDDEIITQYTVYATEEAANAAGNGSSITHLIDGVTYYIPNSAVAIHYGDNSDPDSDVDTRTTDEGYVP